jgi:hypothetical protein
MALSGHAGDARRCRLLGVKRTLGKLTAMSANDPKRTSNGQTGRVAHWNAKARDGQGLTVESAATCS